MILSLIMFQSTKDALGRSQKHKKEFSPSDTPGVSEGLNLSYTWGMLFAHTPVKLLCFVFFALAVQLVFKAVFLPAIGNIGWVLSPKTGCTEAAAALRDLQQMLHA